MSKKIKQIIEESNSLTKKLYEETQIKELSDQTNFEEWPEEWKHIYFKSYPRLPQIKLREPSEAFLKKRLSGILLDRSSDRNFHSGQITKDEISNLLFFSAGITKKAEDWDNTSRAYPSAGARYPSEVYLVVFSSEDLEKGLYHYNVKTHDLELLLKGDLTRDLLKITKQKWIKNVGVVLVITSVLGRSEVKYDSRAFRFCLIEAGHLGQNIYLVSTALNLKCCAIGGFVDKDINSLLDLNDSNEFTSYLLAVGR